MDLLVEEMRILVVEDDAAYAEVVLTMLARNPELTVHTEHVDTLTDALAQLETYVDEFDVVLLDLRLPDEQGLRTIKRIADAAPDVAIVVMTALREQQMAFEAIKVGAQEYVVKDDLTPQLLLRTIRYGFERKQLLSRVSEAERASERERELRRLERMADPQSSSVTAGMYGDAPVRVHLAERYDEAIQEYSQLLDQALEDRAYKGGPSINEDLRSLANVLGVLRAGPRDVVELHTSAMKQLMDRAGPERAHGYVEEGRLLVLELMGYLAAYYRARAVQERRTAVATTEKGTV